MTIEAHRRQVADVRASLLVDARRETHNDVYNRRRPRVPVTVTVESVTASIRDLGVLLVDAQNAEARSWLTLRLRNRIELLEILDGRGGRLK